VPVVRVEGELDPHAAGSLLEAMQDAMGRNGSQVIIDLKDGPRCVLTIPTTGATPYRASCTTAAPSRRRVRYRSLDSERTDGSESSRL